jgi:hypothetical protein
MTAIDGQVLTGMVSCIHCIIHFYSLLFIASGQIRCSERLRIGRAAWLGDVGKLDPDRRSRLVAFAYCVHMSCCNPLYKSAGRNGTTREAERFPG